MIGRVLAAALVLAPMTALAAPTDLSVPASQTVQSWSPDLGDPVLAGLLDRANAGSLDIRMALARLEKARADVDLARAGRRPHLTIGAEAAVGAANFSSTDTGVGAPLLGSYEVDVFHRLKRGVDAAKADETAAALDVTAARQLVLAEVARTYVTLRVDQAHRAVAEASVNLASRTQSLIRRRALEDAATRQDLASADLARVQARAELQHAVHAVEADRMRLGLLLGQDGPVEEPTSVRDWVPVTPPLIAASSETVQARPDIQAALARLHAADARRAEAVAASRPRFMLTAGLGSGDADLLYLLDVRALAWALTGGLTHELFDGGAAKARKRGAAAEADLAELSYRKAVGEAWGQARLNLASLDDATVAETVATSAWTQASRSLETGRIRHQDGDIDGVALAALETKVTDAGLALTNAQGARAQAYVDLMLALGGRSS